MLAKLTSRKFLLTLIAQIVGIFVLLYPEHESAIVEAATSASALLLQALTIMGYVKAESQVDSARASRYLIGPAFESTIETRKTAGMILMCGLLLVGLTGCTPVNTAKIDADQVATTAQPASLATMDSEGDIKASYQGVAPTGLMQDSEGTWMTTPGQGGVVTFNPQTGMVYLWSPKDARVEGVKVTPEPEPGSPSFEAQLIETNLSSVASVYAGQFTTAMEAIKDMTRAEAEAKVEQLEKLGVITGQVAELITTTILPYLP